VIPVVERETILSGVLGMLRVNMGVKARETVHVLTDCPNEEQWRSLPAKTLQVMQERALLAKLVAEIACDELPDCKVRFATYPSLGRNGIEPSAKTAEFMRDADVLIMITSFSLTHTDAREAASRVGVRVASMPRFVPEMFAPGGPMSADYLEVEDLTRRIAGVITAATTAVVRSPAGTDITFSIEGRNGRVDAGIYDKPGAWGNLPAGEAYVAPFEGTAEGTLVAQSGWWPGLKEDMVLQFSAGQVVSMEGGGTRGQELRKLLSPGREEEPYKSRRNLGELGVGTNPKARRTDITVEAEKIMGTVHLAIGDGSHMGGVVVADVHEDFVIPRPTLLLDDRLIMDEGRLVI